MLKAEVLARLMRPFRVEAAKVWVSRLFTSTLPLLAVAFRLSRLPPVMETLPLVVVRVLD